jgi:integrase
VQTPPYCVIVSETDITNGVVSLASIRKQSGASGTRWRAQVRRKGYEQQSAYFSRKTDAEHWARDVESKIDAGKHLTGAESKKHSVAELIDRYCVEILPHKKSAKDQRQQLKVWKKHLGALKLSEVTTDRILAARKSISEQSGRSCDQVSNATVNRYWAALSHVFEIATREYGWLEQNPMKRIKKLKEPQGRVRFLDKDERSALFEACAASVNPYLETIVLIALTTGMRRGEILGLTWDRVNLETGLVIIEEPKNGQRRSNHFLQIICDRLGAIKTNTAANSAFVFPSRNGLKPNDIKSAWYTAVKDAGLEDFRFHDLRHTAASYIAMDGGTIPEIAAVLGHKSFQMASRYAHLSEGHTKNIIQKTMNKVIADD